MRIGVSLPTKREARWERDLKRLQEAAANIDADLLYEVSENSAEMQAMQCDELLKKGISVLILAPHDANSAGKIVQKAKKIGVKVISYDRLILNTDLDLYISFDSVRVGELQAAYLTKKAPRGNYILISGAITDNNAKLLRTGALNIISPLEKKGNIKIIADEAAEDWSQDEAERITEEAIEKYSDNIHAVIAPNDATAGGVIRALKRHHLAGLVPVSGQDADVEAVHRIMSGLQAMTVFKDSNNLATAAIGAAMTMSMGEPPPTNNKIFNGKMQVPALLLEPVSVDSSNIVPTLIQTGYLSREQVYSNPDKSNNASYLSGY